MDWLQRDKRKRWIERPRAGAGGGGVERGVEETSTTEAQRHGEEGGSGPGATVGVEFVAVRCPRCGSKDQGVVNTLAPDWGLMLRERYHLCRGCGERFKSVERLAAGDRLG